MLKQNKPFKYLIAALVSLIASSVLSINRTTTMQLEAGSGGPCGGPSCSSGGPCTLEVCVEKSVNQYTFNALRFAILSVAIFIILIIIMQLISKLRPKKS